MTQARVHANQRTTGARGRCSGAAWLVAAIIAAAAIAQESPHGYLLLTRPLSAASITGPLYRVDLSSGTPVLMDSGQCTGPCYSPDGAKVAYARDNSIYVKSSDGTGDPQDLGIACPTGSMPVMNWVVRADSEFIYWSESTPHIYRTSLAQPSKQTAWTGTAALISASISLNGKYACARTDSDSIMEIDLSAGTRVAGTGSASSISPTGRLFSLNNLSGKECVVMEFFREFYQGVYSPPSGSFDNHRFSRSNCDYMVFTADDTAAYLLRWRDSTVTYGGIGTAWDYFSAEPGTIDLTAPQEPAYVIAEPTSYSTMTLKWSAAADEESGIAFYNIYKIIDGVETRINTAFRRVMNESGLSELSENSYLVSAVNLAGMESPLSSVAAAATPADTFAPEIISVRAVSDSTRVIIRFSEPLDPTSARDAANYSINPEVIVESASYDSAGVVVNLKVSGLQENITYTLEMRNVKDRAQAANAIASPKTREFSFIKEASQERITVLFPNGGETFSAGDTITIRWEADEEITNVVIQFSADNGKTWNQITPRGSIGRTSEQWGAFPWVVPEEVEEGVATVTDRARIEVKSYFDPDRDISDSAFAIVPRNQGAIRKGFPGRRQSGLTVARMDNGRINISFPPEIRTDAVKVFDISGRMLMRVPVVRGAQSNAIRAPYGAGMYMVGFRNNNQAVLYCR
jgi:hypothetical protein